MTPWPMFDDDASLPRDDHGLQTVFDDDDDDESQLSASEFEDKQNLPECIFFGPKECRAIMNPRSAEKGVKRVCGSTSASCSRRNHNTSVLAKGEVGYYAPLLGSKGVIDGKLDSFLSVKDYQFDHLTGDLKESTWTIRHTGPG